MDRGGVPIAGAGAATNGLRSSFSSMGIAASGLSAQRTRIEVIAENIANAETTRTEGGTPYRRKVVQLGEVPFPEVMGARGGAVAGGRAATPVAGAEVGGVRVLGVSEDGSEGPVVYDPGHPDADGDGYVRLSNVSITDELVDLMEARRLYEANASVFDAVKSMLRRSTQL